MYNLVAEFIQAECSEIALLENATAAWCQVFYVLRAGLGAAIEYANAIGIEAMQDRAWLLAASLRERLTCLSGAKVCDSGAEARNQPVLLRAAPHYYNTESELDQLLIA